jgi:hypothetical protein
MRPWLRSAIDSLPTAFIRRRIGETKEHPRLILLAISDATEPERTRFELEGQKEFAEKLIDSIRAHS